MSGYSIYKGTTKRDEYVKCDICRKRLKEKLVLKIYEELDTYVSLSPFINEFEEKSKIIGGKRFTVKSGQWPYGTETIVCDTCKNKYRKYIKRLNKLEDSFLADVNSILSNISKMEKLTGNHPYMFRNHK